ncbi:MAG: hypothetical protein PCFJNLEI_03630 [Verrucomicrobiae bacterium]|nr:hypothetical protein [Verrucomicrobiae bacterium]
MVMTPRVKALLAGCALIVAVGVCVFTLRPTPERVDRAASITLGQLLADETARAVPGGGQVVAVIADYHRTGHPVWRDQWKAFQDQLAKYPALKLVPPEIVPATEAVSLADILPRHGNAAAWAFFVNPPTAEDLAALPESAPKLIAVGDPNLPPRGYYGPWLRNGALAAVILPCAEPAASGGCRYRAFTAANAGELPEFAIPEPPPSDVPELQVPPRNS